MLGTGGDTNVYPTEKSLLTGMESTSMCLRRKLVLEIQTVVGSSGRMVTGSLNRPGHPFMPAGSLLIPEARQRQEGSMDSGAPSGLAG